jgi:inner membrane protein
MYQLGHYGAALLAYAPLGFLAVLAGSRTAALLGGAVALALATLPDVDHRVPGVSHRGITHTVWFALAVGLVVGVAGAVLGTDPAARAGLGLFGFAVGTLAILSHLGADALTPMGVWPFVPLRDDHYTLDVTPAKNSVANVLLLAAGVVVTVGAFVLARALAD